MSAASLTRRDGRANCMEPKTGPSRHPLHLTRRGRIVATVGIAYLAAGFALVGFLGVRWAISAGEHNWHERAAYCSAHQLSDLDCTVVGGK